MDKRKDAGALSEAELDTLFRASEGEAPLPSGDLITRIMADAEAEQAVAALASSAPRPSGLAGLREALGGWAGLSGLAGAAAMGLIIGVFPPEVLSTYSDTVLGISSATFSDYVPGLGEVQLDG
ncbi:MAG: hypothetical protein AAGA47_10135 [Pseudomonadota bacterium]